MFLAVLLKKLFALIINSVKMLFFTEGKILLTDLLKQFLVSILLSYLISENLIMSAEKKKYFN